VDFARFQRLDPTVNGDAPWKVRPGRGGPGGGERSRLAGLGGRRLTYGAVARQRDLLVNFERMRREMDELFGDVWGERPRRSARPQHGFSPRVDVYYCGDPSPESGAAAKAIVKAELAGVGLDTINLEICGRELVISGERPVQETEGRVYQQLEIEAGPFRRVVELNADVAAGEARATYEDGVLRVELPLRQEARSSRQVPIDSREQ
jgi:HSP20 family protein